MQYMTTGGSGELFSSARAFAPEEPEMGTFFPERILPLTAEDWAKLASMDFADSVAFILNRFCDKEIFGWNIGLWAGRTPLRIVTTKFKTHIAELWHNSGWEFSYLEQVLHSVLGISGDVSLWAHIVVRIAVIWGTYNEMLSRKCLRRGEHFDLVVREGDLSGLLAACYARKMGLPLGTCICGGCEESSLWELCNYGQVHLLETKYSAGMEHLIFCTLGQEARNRYMDAQKRKGVFVLTDEEQEVLSKGIYISVLSKQRAKNLMNTVKEFHMGEDTAVFYGALQYYRAAKSETAPALILAEKPPEREAPVMI